MSRDAIAKIDAVAAAAREVRRVRAEALRNLKGGLRALHRTLELPGANPLKDAHAALDAAVLAAYGFDAKKDLFAQPLALNQEAAAKIGQGSPVTAPGVPAFYPDPQKLGTEDCIAPPGGGRERQKSDGSTAQSHADAGPYDAIKEAPPP